jgi:UDP-glucose:(heptosyl)LPS alpha-1,3-glucosyltransferase
MKLAMLIYRYFPYGGQQRDFMQILNRVLAAGHQVDIYCLQWQGELPAGAVVHKVPVSAFSRHTLYQRFSDWVSTVIQRDPVDLVVGFSKMPGLDVYYAADPCFAARMARESRWLTRLLPRYRHFCNYERAVFAEHSKTEVLLLSPQQQQDFSSHYPGCRQRLHLLPPGISPDRCLPDNPALIRQQFRAANGFTDEHKVALLVGSGFRVKGVDRAIRAVAALPPQLRQQTRLLIVGQGKTAGYLRLARRLQVGEQVIFAGARDDVPHFMLGADLLLHPAYYESAGYTLIEAILHGLPVLTTDTCGYAFHVRQAAAGQLCPSPFQQKDLNARLHEMLISSDAVAWRANALAYSGTVDLFGMADAALMLLERFAADKAL